MITRPNILFLIVDSLRADKFHAAVERSQLELARLIRERGVRFESMYAVASTTTPCFGSILTGLYPARNGLRSHRGDKLGRDVVTLAQRLRETGYTTRAHVTGPLGPETDLQRGFDYYDFRDRKRNEYGSFGGQVRHHLRGLRDAGGPWFEFIHFWILHRTRRYSLLYRSLMKAENPAWQDRLCVVDAALSRLWQDWSMEATYDRSVDCILFYLDCLLREVDLTRTAVVIMGDHGEYVETKRDKYPLHDFFPANRDHAFHVYEFLVRVPFVLLLPQQERPVPVFDFCSQVDIAPTLLEFAGNGGEYQGRSLVPCIRGGKLPDRPVFFEAVGGKHLQEDKLIAGVRFGNWKFIHAPHSTAFQPELFDLRDDPHEDHNLASARADVVARARELLDVHYREKLSPDSEVKMTAEEEAIVTQRLKELGYIE